MNELKLSKRLERVASYIPNGAIVADIGSDHAYLPCYIVLNGIVDKVIAGEVVDGPFKSALEQVEKLHLSDKIDVRKGDGLEVIAKNEVNCITIAGMGGSLITNILDAGKEKLHDDGRLVLQPNIGAEIIRKWLFNEGWELISEEILEEDGKIYEILVAEKGNPHTAYQGMTLQTGFLLGPFLLREKNSVFIRKWQLELTHLKKIEQQLLKSTKNSRNQTRLTDVREKIKLIEEVL